MLIFINFLMFQFFTFENFIYVFNFNFLFYYLFYLIMFLSYFLFGFMLTFIDFLCFIFLHCFENFNCLEIQVLQMVYFTLNLISKRAFQRLMEYLV